MPQFDWNAAQNNCITARGGSVLVSAAAGSGKTAVLVERVICRITDTASPVDIDRLLIVTFTKAAAAEMKRRLAVRLGELLVRDPENTRLQRQQMLLPGAMIATIDGFCTALLREHFDTLGLSPRFSVAEEREAALLKDDALEETLEVFYAAAEDGFLQLCGQLNGRRDDSGIKDAVLKTYDFISAQAFPLKWLREHCFPEAAGVPLGGTGWGKTIRRYAAEKLAFLQEYAAGAAAPLAAMPECAAYSARLSEDIGMLERTARILADDTAGWDACIRALAAAVPGKLPAVRKLDKSYTEPVKDAWGVIREELRKKLLPLFGENEETAQRDIAATAPRLSALCELLEMFTERYTAKKRAAQLLDFGDVEHLTLQLLYDPAADAPTPLAAELAGRYAEILVDEYQDTNEVQDTIFRMLSGENNTLFMVGDVKQSIYGFRQAMPQLFMQKKAAFAPYDGVTFPACITLGENYRSRREVTGTVNYIFEQLMTPGFCGIDYAAGEQLLPAAPYPDGGGDAAELLLLDTAAGDETPSAAEAEARLIAARIRTLMADGTVADGDGTRPLRYGDICILLRSRSTHAALYAEVLQSYGIPVAMDTGTPFFEAGEIQLALAVLQVIDNPLRDIPLMTLLLSPAGGFTADDCARMRLYATGTAGKAPALYTALTLSADPAATLPKALRQRAAAFTAQLRRYRRLAVSLPADALLSRILEETPLSYIAAAGADGETRVANLRQLLQLAREYTRHTGGGLSAFVRRLDRMQEINTPLTLPPAVHGDAVRVMTMHGSKGLEFPVVILSHLFGEFHRDAARQSLLLHGGAGAALTGYDEAEMTAFPTVSANGVRTAMRRTALAEELRILYVALTRAREKLILVAVKSHLSARLRRLAAFLPLEKCVDAARMLSLNCYADWLLLALLRHPDAAVLRSLAGAPELPVLPGGAPLICRLISPEELPDAAPDTSAAAAEAPAPEAVAALRQKFRFQYPFAALHAVPVKLAASELAHRETAAEFVAVRRPAFLSEKGMTPAERGTALHTFMQYAAYDAAAADPAREADRLLRGGFLSAPQRAALDIDRIRTFFESGLYARMCAAPRLWREYAFAIPLAAGAVRPELPPPLAAETLMVQGIADCAFEEAGALVIVDYKTDRIREDEALAKLYQKQLAVYRQALEETLGLPVRETLLYAFYTGHTVLVP